MALWKSLGLLLLSFNCYEYLKLSVISKYYKQLFLTVLVLGTDRVEQMTKTYNDIDLVTHLLAEVRIYLSFFQYKKLKLDDRLKSIKFADQMKNSDIFVLGYSV